jgi:hypothetical protein
MNPEGKLSGQVDVVVLKPYYPKRMLDEKIWLSDGILAVFECKNTLRSREIGDIYKNCAVIKQLTRPFADTPYHLTQCQPLYGVLAHSHEWRSNPEAKFTEHFQSALSDVAHPRYMIDIVCVADLATLSKSVWGVCNHKDSQVFGMMLSTRPYELGGAGAPIGALLTCLMSKLKMEDPIIETFSRYFSRALPHGMGGTGQGMASSRNISLICARKNVTGRISGARRDSGSIFHA